jgi:putative methyltransferase (TIGR04325 family)
MGPFGLLHRAVDALRDFAPVRLLGRAAYARKFAKARDVHIFHGVFDSFDQAVAWIPQSRLSGYDNVDSARLYENRLKIDDYDYPALFWISASFQEGMKSVVDLGGSIGIKYYAFSETIALAQDLKWTVVDVPTVVDQGKKFAEQKGLSRSRLDFSASTSVSNGVDILYVSGALQYLPMTLSEILETLSRKPRRIIVNTTPLHETKSFFTVNNIGTALCAYRVQARGPFIKSVEAQGYRLRDSWSNISKRMNLPYEPGHSIENYSGFCFDRI